MKENQKNNNNSKKRKHEMKRFKFVLWLWMCLLSVPGHAQFMGDPREKFSLTATVDGNTNTDYTWKAKHDGERLAGGRLENGVNVRLRSSISVVSNKLFSVSITPFYHFSTREFQTDWGAERLGFQLPSAHHHYGSSMMATYNMMAWGKPLTFMGMGTANFSQYGYENVSGILGGMVAVTRNQKTFLGLGAICLLGTSVNWPLFPLFIYTHKFDNHWSISCMEVNNYLYYQVSPKVKCSVGMELETDKYYFRPHVEGLPKKAQLNLVYERLGVFADVQATKDISMNVGFGVNVPFYGRLRESGYAHDYMLLRDHVKPFLKMSLKYSLKRTPVMR